MRNSNIKKLTKKQLLDLIKRLQKITTIQHKEYKRVWHLNDSLRAVIDGLGPQFKK